MRKLKLRMDELRVETFETLAITLPALGTVRAQQAEGGPAYAAGTDASNCATCDTCVGPNCCGCANSTAA